MTTPPAPDERLARAVQRRHEARTLELRVQGARDRLVEAEHDADRLAARLTAEERDVERLEHLSWSRTWAALKGSHADDLERERAERDAASYAARAARTRVEQARAEVEDLLRRLAELGDVEAERATALEEKERWLAAHDPEAREHLHRVAEERGRLGEEDREGREAFDAGRTAHEHLTAAGRTLESARSWSTWDTFGGGGMFSDMMKYDRLDEVAQHLRRADAALRTFATELADVHLPAVRTLEISGLTRTFDVWFDNLFSDWAVRDRIVQAQDRVDEASHQVEAVLDRLRDRKTEIDARQGELAAERDRLLMEGSQA